MTVVTRAPGAAGGAPSAGALRRDGGRVTAQHVVVAIAVAAFLALCVVLRGFVTDDSWISVRYAENLARGDGFVWNPGGPRVEGYSNPALVGLEAVVSLLGGSAIGAARVLGVLCGAGCVVVVYTRGRAVVGEAAALAASVLTALSAPFALWAVGGLETLPVALVLTAAVLELARPGGGRPALAGALLAVLPWLRPEGLVVAGGVVALSEVGGLLRRSTRGETLRRLTWTAGLPVLSQAVLELLRLGVYGHLLPNSVLYKSGTGQLFTVAGKFLAQAALVVLLAVVGAVVARGRQRLLLAPFAVYLLGSLGTLDSANGYSRFFMPVLPQLAVLAGLALAAATRTTASRSGRPPAGWWRTVVLAVGVGATALTVMPARLGEVHQRSDAYMTCHAGARADVARWLVAETPADTTFSVSDAGLLPARAGGRTAFDAFLLNDPLLQRTGPQGPRARARVVHARRPDVVVLASRRADRFVPVYPTEAALVRHPGMAAYDLAHVGSGGASCGYHLFAYRR